jgi:hypothetical protein
MVSYDHFRQELLAQMERSQKRGAVNVLINSAELQAALGEFPSPDAKMPACCDAMEKEMKPGDILLVERSHGAGMTVRYFLPRYGIATLPNANAR